ncbi:MAG: amidohydrolase family protein, partial [Gemmatimonadetes bacterium]|nr:amidohydrolase family protein [Gemmatimonadota bacterium]
MPAFRLAVAHLLSLAALVACAADRYDVLLVGGTVVDGTGAPGQRADVGIRDGRIAMVGDLSTAAADTRMDVAGLVVAPGFIDPHTHARERLLAIPTADNLIRQGITTLVDGNDGSSPLPLGAFLDSVAAARPAPNVALFAGHGSIRRAVMGTENREATPAELARMDSLMQTAMADGALGLSSGLFYVPGSYAPTSELVQLARTAHAAGGVYTSHMRNEDDSVVASVVETIRIARESGIPAHISHHKVGGRRNYGRSERTLALMDEARAAGLDVTYDQYPYTASHTSISSIVPAWARANDSLAARLAQPSLRTQIRREMQAFVEMRFANDPSKLQLSRCGFDSTLAGRTLAEVLQARRTPSSADAITDLILELVARGG